MLVAALAAVALVGAPVAMTQEKADPIDATVKRFLDQHRTLPGRSARRAAS
jgi:O-antigen ligase